MQHDPDSEIRRRLFFSPLIFTMESITFVLDEKAKLHTQPRLIHRHTFLIFYRYASLRKVKNGLIAFNYVRRAFYELTEEIVFFFDRAFLAYHLHCASFFHFSFYSWALHLSSRLSWSNEQPQKSARKIAGCLFSKWLSPWNERRLFELAHCWPTKTHSFFVHLELSFTFQSNRKKNWKNVVTLKTGICSLNSLSSSR